MAVTKRRIDPKKLVKDQDASYKVRSEWTLKWEEIVWKKTILLIMVHVFGAIGMYKFIFQATWGLRAFAIGLYIFAGLGITAGAHRLWSHKSYSARWPLRVFLLFANTMAGQGSIIHWSRDHRCHHLYSETEADPHDQTKGFFFSHVGWLLVKKDPKVIEAGKQLDMSDLSKDWMLRLQNTYITPISFFVSYAIPTFIGGYFFFEQQYWLTFWVACAFRHCFILNATWTVNSLAHFFGERTYDDTVSGTENLIVCILTLGEGFHNYHHKFPWDWKTSEFCWGAYNPTAWFITVMKWMGLAYDLKQADQAMIDKSKQKQASKMKKLHSMKSQVLSGASQMAKKMTNFNVEEE